MTVSSELHVVTGAFGFSGKYIAQRLLARGHRVRTLTDSGNRQSPFGNRIEVAPFNWDTPASLTESLRGVKVIYNTYWVRFSDAGFSQDIAVENTKKLFAAAKAAGVERVIHVSITNPSENSPYEYFRGKATLEDELTNSGLAYSILRPAVLGREGILINNIAWVLRRFPVFGVFGNGAYRLQPIHVEDFADLAVREGERSENVVVEAIGPDTFTYDEMVREMSRALLGRERLMVHFPTKLALAVAKITGRVVGDVVVTDEEIRALMDDLLYVDAPPAGTTALIQWVTKNADWLGETYMSEVARRRDRQKAY